MNLEHIILSTSYFVLGFSLKFLDWERLNKKKALVLGVLSGALMGYRITSDSYSAAIFLAVIMGSLFSRKIDTRAFKAGALTVALSIILTWNLNIHLTAVVFLSVLAFFDEYGNDWADKSLFKDRIVWFFKNRMLMKTGILFSVLVFQFPTIYAIAFLLF
ncbi:MAG: hypothetical protein KKD39_02810, partial [Candidatus Altiarchaeota archaeon]|nr:hypothetical protein [Candidatus Altiarchaeota archaeon]